MDKEAFWKQLCVEMPSLVGEPEGKLALSRTNFERLLKHAFDQGYVEGRQDTCETPALNNFLADMFGKKKS